MTPSSAATINIIGVFLVEPFQTFVESLVVKKVEKHGSLNVAFGIFFGCSHIKNYSCAVSLCLFYKRFGVKHLHAVVLR